MIVSNLILKKIWKLLFFDIIFAEEILIKDLRIRIINTTAMMLLISTYNNKEAMAFHCESHLRQVGNPRFDFGFKIMQVHKFRQIG